MESFEEVYYFLVRLSGNKEVAEELTQQTFSIAFEKLENFRGECKLSVWLCQIAKHEYYAWIKKQKRYANELDENQTISICDGMANISIWIKIIIIFCAVFVACFLGFSEFGGMLELFVV